jgi:hypothetical protein
MLSKAAGEEETIMFPDLQDRRKSGRPAAIVDEAINLAHEYGWSYALAYLISERIPPATIQRLMFGGGREHREHRSRDSYSCGAHLSSAWRENKEMRELFVSLHRRKSGKRQ